MRSSGSKGKYLNEHIKKHYDYVKVKGWKIYFENNTVRYTFVLLKEGNYV
jgi:hypothetical protein